MKKLLLLALLCGFLVSGAIGCGDSTPAKTTPPASGAKPAEPAK
jgi:hypothetical protein